MQLPETQAAFSELAANSELTQGVHTHSRARTGSNGLPLGDIPFDASRHAPWEINPLSLMADVMGAPHVSQVLPSREVSLNVLTDFGRTGDSLAVANLKHGLNGDITSAIEDALPSITDRLFKYSFGNAPVDIRNGDYDTLPDANDEERADSAVRLCINGLTLIISDFKHLPLRKVTDTSLEGIAIKVNHPLELAIKPGLGIISLGGLVEVNTNKPEELDKVNTMLAERRQAILDSLGQSGLQVVEVVYSSSQPGNYDVAAADAAIAKAIRSYSNS